MAPMKARGEAPFDACELFGYAPASKILGLLRVQITHIFVEFRTLCECAQLG